MTMTMALEAPFDDGADDCTRLRAGIESARRRIERAGAEKARRAALVAASLQEHLIGSEAHIAEIEAYFAISMSLVRDAAAMEVQRVLDEGRCRVAQRCAELGRALPEPMTRSLTDDGDAVPELVGAGVGVDVSRDVR